jgi:hypothetical protein
MFARKNCLLVAADSPCAVSTGARVFDASSSSEDVRDPALHAAMIGCRASQLVPSSSDDEVVATGNRAAVAVIYKGGIPKIARATAKRARDKMRARMARRADPRARRPAKQAAPTEAHDTQDVPDAPDAQDAREATNAQEATNAPDHSRPRRHDLWRFFVTWKRIEHKGNNVRHSGASILRSADLLAEFQTFTGQMQYHWVHMYELWRLYERQQIAQRSPLRSREYARERTRDMMLSFYYLALPQQHVLVDDWIVERTARQRSRNAADLETCLARKALAKIKTDMLVVVANIDYVLREGIAPHKWQGAFEGI